MTNTTNLRLGQQITVTFRQGGSKGTDLTISGIYTGFSPSPTMGDTIKVDTRSIKAHNIRNIEVTR